MIQSVKHPLPQSIACTHCGTFFETQTSERFCCVGCEFVFNLIQSQDLGHYYQIRDANPPICPVPAQTSSSTYDFCDDLEFIRKLSPDGLRLRFYLQGLNCTACLWLLERLPTFCDDAESARINMADSTIEVRRKPNGSFAAIARTLNRFGYRPHPLRETETSTHLQKQERRQDLIRIGVAAAATGNIMIFAVSLYAGASGPLANQFRWLSGFLALPVLTYCAWPFYRSSLASLKSRHLNLDVPIVAALLAGVIISTWGLFASAETVYFDSLSMLVFLLLSSRFVLKGVQNRQLLSTNLEDELLLGTIQRVMTNGETEKVSSLALNPGDLIRVELDAVIPVDGIVESGFGAINAAVMTGESEPIQIAVGSKIEAGCQNLGGHWTLRVQNPPAQTRLAQILRDTEKSASTKSEFVHFSDKVSALFITIVLAVATFLVIRFIGTDPHEGITRALALVIVTCPCVFGIAIPLSMSFAIRNAAQRGIIIKNNDAIERLWKVKTLFFDKTGTLTLGEMSVLNIDVKNKLDLRYALALEKNQTHPVARALSREITQRLASQKDSQIPFDLTFNLTFDQVQALPEGGVSGHIEGIAYSVRPLSHNPQINSVIDSNISSPANSPVNTTPLIRSSYGLYRDSELLATFLLGDKPRPQALDILQWARKSGFTTRMISGDKKHVVDACAKALGFTEADIQSETTPENKAKTLAKTVGTAMIGDGANDAAALASADVGIAVCGSLDVSLRAADVYLTRPNLDSIRELFMISRLTKIAIRRNLIFSASFNLISGLLAASGMMTPLWAAVLMPISSLTILMSAVWTGNRMKHLKENL